MLGDNAKTTICLTRYGNVMGSRGSVIPLFYKLIKEGKPLTVTDPEMTRYMMTLEDAVKLVMYAFEHGNQGDLFVQKAPGATIDTLAKAVKKYKNSDAEIKIIGTRHGEKDHEVLVTREEMTKAEDLGEYYRVPMDNRDLNYDKFYPEGDGTVRKVESYTSNNTRQLDVDGMVELLKEWEKSKNENPSSWKNGMLGHVVYNYFKELGIETFGTVSHNPSEGDIEFDAFKNMESIQK